jgi:hypothetical protein
MIGQETALVHYSLLGGVAFEKLNFWCCLGGVSVAVSGNRSLFYNSSFFFSYMYP